MTGVVEKRHGPYVKEMVINLWASTRFSWYIIGHKLYNNINVNHNLMNNQDYFFIQVFHLAFGKMLWCKRNRTEEHHLWNNISFQDNTTHLISWISRYTFRSAYGYATY